MFLQWCRDGLFKVLSSFNVFVSWDRTQLRKGTTAETQTLCASIVDDSTNRRFKKMAIPKDKEELVKAIADNYKKLTSELSTIPTDLTTIKELEGHSKNTLMSINDLVAYLVGWGQLLLKWNDKKSKGLAVDFPETGFKWNELGLLAQKFYKDYEKDDFKTLNKKLDKTTTEILNLIESKTNKELYEVAWFDKWTFGKMIQLNTSSPFKNAKDRIRKWKKTKQLK